MLAYMTADVGAHHNRAWVLGHDLAGAWTNVHDLIASGGAVMKRSPKAVVSDRSAEYVIASQHTRSLFDALGNCRLQMMELGFEEEHYAELYSMITGRKKSWADLLKYLRAHLAPYPGVFGAGDQRLRPASRFSPGTVIRRTQLQMGRTRDMCFPGKILIVC